jgi:MFS family permease
VARVPRRRLAGFYFFYFAYLGTFAPFFGLYLESIGLTPFAIGAVLSLPQITRIVAPHLWSWLADRRGTPVGVARLAGLAGTGAFLAIFAGTQFALVFGAILAMTFFWSAALPLMEATTLTHLGDETARYGRIRVWGSVGFIVAVVIVGHLLDHVRLAAVPVLVFAMMLGMLACLWIVPEARVPHHEEAAPTVKLMLRPEVLALIGAGACMSAAHGPYYTFYSIYLVGEGYSKSATGWLWALGVACESACSRGCRGFIARSRCAASSSRASRSLRCVFSRSRGSRRALSHCSSRRCCTPPPSARFTPPRSAMSTSFSGDATRRAVRRFTGASLSASAGRSAVSRAARCGNRRAPAGRSRSPRRAALRAGRFSRSARAARPHRARDSPRRRNARGARG